MAGDLHYWCQEVCPLLVSGGLFLCFAPSAAQARDRGGVPPPPRPHNAPAPARTPLVTAGGLRGQAAAPGPRLEPGPGPAPRARARDVCGGTGHAPQLHPPGVPGGRRVKGGSDGHHVRGGELPGVPVPPGVG